MRKFICSVCGYIYNEEVGDPENSVNPRTKWTDITSNWSCPLCGAGKDEFSEVTEAKVKTEDSSQPSQSSNDDIEKEDLRELSLGELSALCSNLSKGCQKQYLTNESVLFNQLAIYFEGKAPKESKNNLSDLDELIQKDLSSGYSDATLLASNVADRGALRVLVWGEKVTKILNSLLSRYDKQKDQLLENTHAFVCEICGFIYIGDQVPAICPVCKVPNKKFTEITRR